MWWEKKKKVIQEEALRWAKKTERLCHSSTYPKRTSVDLQDQSQDKPYYQDYEFYDDTMDGVVGAVKKIPCVIVIWMGNGEIAEIMSIRITSIEEHDGRGFAAMRMIHPKIMKMHMDQFIFQDMLTLVDIRQPLEEEEYVNKKLLVKELPNSENNEENTREKV